MKKLRISIPVIIAFLSSLALLMMAGPETKPRYAGHRTAVANTAAPVAASGTTSVTNDSELRLRESSTTSDSKLFVIRKPVVTASVTHVPGAEEIAWVAALYPELARIARLEEQDPDRALPGLLPMLASDDPVVRLAALESVADMNHAAKLPSLFAALDDPSAQVRIAALEALVLHGDPSTSSTIESLVYDQAPAVRAAAVDALAVLANPASIPVLAGLLYEPDRQVRINAIGALGEIGGADALRYLRQLRYDADESVRVSARAILDEEALAAAF